MKARCRKMNYCPEKNMRYEKAYMVVNSDWTLQADSLMCRQPGADPQKLALNKIFASALPEGFKIYRTLKACAADIRHPDENLILEIQAIGTVRDFGFASGWASYVHEIKPVRSLSPFSALELANDGSANAGKNNKGDYNTGSGNIGNYNTGFGNIGDYNSGSCNRGKENSGQANIGDYNSGQHNIGSFNAGWCNEGNNNIGNYNNGHANSGNNNKGNRNAGHYNHTNCSNGAFNTAEPKIYLFDKPSDWTLFDFEHSEAFEILKNLALQECQGMTRAVAVSSRDMSEDERSAHPEHITTGCFVEPRPYKPKHTPQQAWNRLKPEERQAIMSLPNFDPDIFCAITGIRVKAAKSPKSPAKKPGPKK